MAKRSVARVLGEGRGFRILSASLAVYAFACADPDAIRVRLITSPQLDPTAFSRIQVVVRDDRGLPIAGGDLGAIEDRVADGQVDLGDLDIGTTYQVRVVGDSDLCGARGRAVGDSRDFVHRDGDYDIFVSLGCADELVTTRRRPNVSRVGHRLVADEAGAAVVGGGRVARFVEGSNDLFFAESAVPLVEYYDPESQQFVAGESLLALRTRPAAVGLPGRGVGVAGGATDNPLVCSDAVERSIGLSLGSSEPLSIPRCAPAAVALPAVDRALIVGSPFTLAALADRSFDAELYDGSLQRRVSEGLAGRGLRLAPDALPLRDGRSALVIGGNPASSGQPAAERFEVSEACPGGCFSAVAGGPDGWVDAANVRVDCNDETSILLMFGGAQDDDTGMRALDDVWCYQDAPGAALVRAPETLPEPRRGAVAAVIQTDERSPRILLAGGASDSISEIGTTDLALLLFELDPCSCEGLGRPQEVNFRPQVSEILIGHDAIQLRDRSVLIVGGVTVTPDASGAEATGGAFLFFPDRDP